MSAQAGQQVRIEEGVQILHLAQGVSADVFDQTENGALSWMEDGSIIRKSLPLEESTDVTISAGLCWVGTTEPFTVQVVLARQPTTGTVRADGDGWVGLHLNEELPYSAFDGCGTDATAYTTENGEEVEISLAGDEGSLDPGLYFVETDDSCTIPVSDTGESPDDTSGTLSFDERWSIVDLESPIPISEFTDANRQSYASWAEDGDFVQSWLHPDKASVDRIPAGVVLFRIHEELTVSGETDSTPTSGPVSVGGDGWVGLHLDSPVPHSEFCGEDATAYVIGDSLGYIRTRDLSEGGELSPGTYLAKVDPPCTIDLSGTEDDPTSSDYHEIRVSHPVDNRGVDDVEVRIYRVSATKDVSGSVSPDKVDLVSRATTDSDGVAVFDGAGGGTPLEREQFDQYRADYATENDAGIVVTCVKIPSGNIGNEWFGTSRYSAGEFFSTDTVGNSLPLDNQLLLPPTSENGVAGTVSIWRQIGPSATRQKLYVELTRSAAMTENPQSTFKTVGTGTMSVKVPESAFVFHDETETSISSDFRQGSNYVSSNTHRYDIASFAADRTTPSLPLHSIFGSGYADVETGLDSDARQARFARDVLGVMPYTDNISTAYDFWDTYLSGEAELVGTLDNDDENGLETGRNTHDTVTSKTWSDSPFGVTFSVPVKFQDATADPQAFGFRGFWSRGTLNGRNSLDYTFSVGPNVDI